jgi:alpha-mannosidase
MDKTIIRSYLQKLEAASIVNGIGIGHWKYRVAEYLAPREYRYLTEWENLDGNVFFPTGRTIFMETVFQFPVEIHTGETMTDYLFISLNHLEGILRIDGAVYHGLDQNRIRMPIRKQMAGRKVTLSLELFGRKTNSDPGERPSFGYSRMACVIRTIEKFHLDLKLAWDTYCMDSVLARRYSGRLDAVQSVMDNRSGSYAQAMLMFAIDKSLRFLDISLDGEDLERAAGEADRILLKEIAGIPVDTPTGTLSLVGHTHIDVAWLWQLKDTVRKCAHSFANMLHLMEEYPEFTFSCSQPQLYEYVKDHYPEIYSGIQKYVAEGRWEIVGPMWVESDCNVVSGESLVRQILYGRQFFLREFGKASNICWLPDTFGFQPNMPQILKKSGIDCFFSYKLHWQAVNRFPYGTFRWVGLDGSEIIASVPELCSGYNGNVVPEEIKYARDANTQKGIVDDVIFTYGWGDGGGGPTYEMLENARRLGHYPGLPACSLKTAAEFFSGIVQKKDSLPSWHGELYLETHRGTYTTQGAAKKTNRKAELLYQQAEKLCVMAETRGMAPDWPSLKNGWKKILLLQFHDILPGSSIREVYEDSSRIYGEIMETGTRLLEEGMRFLAGLKDTSHPDVFAAPIDRMQPNARIDEGQPAALSVSGQPAALAVFNGLSWDRTDLVRFVFPEGFPENGFSLFNKSGEKVPYDMECLADGRACMDFIAAEVPALGMNTYAIQVNPLIEPVSDRDRDIVLERQHDVGLLARPDENSAVTTWRNDEGIHVNSRYFNAVIDNKGRMVLLEDKRAERIAVGRPANEFSVYLDGPQGEDAWNLYEEYKERMLDYPWQDEIGIKSASEVKTVVSVLKKSEKAVIRQDIIFYGELDRIDFVTRIDWKERHKVLKVAFPLEIQTPYAAFDTGFGTCLRPAFQDNSFEKAKFEVVGHKWADLSEGEYGVSLLNDCKYGHDIKGSTLSLTLLRGTTSPDVDADQGEHEITYSLYPHRGDWRTALTARKGLELNVPLSSVPTLGGQMIGGQQRGTSGKSFMTVDNPNLIIDTVKPAEDGDGMIARLYECNGNRGKAGLDFGFGVESACEANLAEEVQGPATWNGDLLSFAFSPYEIKTFRIRPAIA